MSDNFYFAEEEKIELSPSKNYVALKINNESDISQLKGVVEKCKGLQNGESAEELNSFDVMLVGVDTDASDEVVSEATSVLTEEDGVESLFPVFQMPNGDPDELMILVPQFRVQFKSDAQEAEINDLNEKYKVEIVEKDDLGPNSYLLRVTPKSKHDALELANIYHQSELTEYSEPDWLYQMKQPAFIVANGSEFDVAEEEIELVDPDNEVAESLEDSQIDSQAIVNDPLYRNQWALRKMRVPQAWRISKGSPAIKIAIVDEGVQTSHPDLSGKIVTPYDAVGNDNNQNPNRWDGHGTACAGIAAATAGNSRGIAGVAPKCKILPVRIAYSRRAGAPWTTSTTWIARGIRTAVIRGADVISNSWGGGSYSSVIRNAFVFAKTRGRGGKGCVVVSASGNRNARNISYPAKYPESLACGASNEWDQRKSTTSRDGENWWGSNYGPEQDFLAPGVHIYTTDITGSGGYTSGNYMRNFNGTSSATPNAAGVAALVLSVDPNLRQWEVRDILRLSARDLGPRGKDDEHGWGRIDALKASHAARRLWYQTRLNLQFLGRGQECYMRFRLFRLYNSGLNRIRINSFTLRSFNPAGNEIDRFTYRGDPSGIMQPGLTAGGGSGDDIRFENVLLKAHGNRSRYRYSWSARWNYTYWRPSRPMTGPAEAGESFASEEESFEENYSVTMQGSDDHSILPPALTKKVEDNASEANTVLEKGPVKVTIQVS
ncbi:MAG: S8 family peptidase [Calditrichia bacterium]